MRLAADVGGSAQALVAIAGARDDWAAPLDVSARGFWRSFAAPVMAVLPALFANAAITAPDRGDAPLPVAALWVWGLTPVIDAAVFAALIALLVAAFGGKAGYAAMIVGANWLNFWLNLILAGLGLLVMFGAPAQVSTAAGFVVVSGSLYLIWRLARESLTGELGLSLAVTLVGFGCRIGGYTAALSLMRVLG